MATTDRIFSQIDGLLEQYQSDLSRSKFDDCSDLPGSETIGLAVLMGDAITRLAPRGSHHRDVFDRFVNARNGAMNCTALEVLAGMLAALRKAYAAGYLSTVSELIHGELFSDFLEMADHLLGEGYKDPAAVITGSVLEEHLRKLCERHGVDVKSGGKPKKADGLNSELAAKDAYSKLDQKSVTAWLDLRNKAAHGKYTEYTKDQVALMLQSVRDFMTRIPA